MLFNSFTFLIFFPVVVTIYFVIPHRWRWAWLLAASSYFYMAFIPVYILILFFTIAVDYVAGILIENAAGRGNRSRCGKLGYRPPCGRRDRIEFYQQPAHGIRLRS